MTATSQIRQQHISRTNLNELLSSEGLSYEALGAGVREALDCLADAREFYALPQALQPYLDRYALNLRLALSALDEAKGVLH